jgi:hypothetical protein
VIPIVSGVGVSQDEATAARGGEEETTTTQPATKVAATATTIRGRWYRRRVPPLVIGAALVLGCVLGGGIVAVGALVGEGDQRRRPGHPQPRGPCRRPWQQCEQ